MGRGVGSPLGRCVRLLGFFRKHDDLRYIRSFKFGRELFSHRLYGNVHLVMRLGQICGLRRATYREVT